MTFPERRSSDRGENLDSPQLAAGESPRYRLVSRIATGSTSEVFLAVMPGACGAGKPVVIKWLWPELARDPESVRMFLDEARVSLSLHHPNVVHTYESGHDGARYFLTMEYLDGQSLKHVLDGLASEGGLSLPLALKVISDVLAGLEYVHSLTRLDGVPMQIVHRDVSPQNVFLTYNGVVKLLDFGIADTAATRDSSRLMRVEGRLSYMAPEQAAGKAVDQRADLFGVGVMLWEMVMGRRLWQGMTDAAIRDRLLSGRPILDLPDTRGFPPALGDICARSLALDPGDRYGSAAEFQSDLATVLTGSAPVQARLLGETVSRLFAGQRALVRSMIQQSLRPAGSNLLAPPGGETAGVDEQPETRHEAAPGRFDRSGGAQIAALGSDATAVGPLPSPAAQASQRRFRLLGALVILASAACGIGVASHFSKPPRSAPPAQPRAAEPSLAIPVSQPAVAAAAPAPVQALESPPSKRVPARSRRHVLSALADAPAIAEAADQRFAPPPVVAPDPFDAPLSAKKRTAARPIDREDPYRQ